MPGKNPLQSIDRRLGRLSLRLLALLAFCAGSAGILFGIVVLMDGHAVGILLLLLGGLFFWLGRRAFRDRATFGELLNRDYQRAGRSQPPGSRQA